MHSLRLCDCESAEAIMLLCLAFDIVLREMSALCAAWKMLSILTPIGFAAVLIAKDRSLKVSDIGKKAKGDGAALAEYMLSHRVH